MTTTTRDYLKTLIYHVAPADQGQMIEVAYAADREHERVIRCVIDWSGSTVRYEAAPVENLIGRWEPWNSAPEFASGTEWRLIHAADLTCTCSSCGCTEPATQLEDETGDPMCEACCEYAVDDEGEVVCSRRPEYEDAGEWTGGGMMGRSTGWVSRPRVRRDR